MSYRVVYGETVPAWDRVVPTKREAMALVQKHESFGDIIFNVAKVGTMHDNLRGFLTVAAQAPEQNG